MTVPITIPVGSNLDKIIQILQTIISLKDMEDGLEIRLNPIGTERLPWNYVYFEVEFPGYAKYDCDRKTFARVLTLLNTGEDPDKLINHVLEQPDRDFVINWDVIHLRSPRRVRLSR